MDKFKNAFFKILEEEIDDAVAPEAVNPEDDAATFDGSFEDPEMAGEFNTDPQLAGFQHKYIERAKEWIAKMTEFSTWLNGTEGDSLNKQLIAMDKQGSPFEGISNEAKKITGIAQDLASLSEGIKGIVLTVDKKQRELQQQPRY
jgi:hypothetical protein